MISEPTVRWIVWAAVVLLAMRCLVKMSTLLRDRLQGLLTAHVKNQQVESLKRRRIVELREKIRAKKANAENDKSKEKLAA